MNSIDFFDTTKKNIDCGKILFPLFYRLTIRLDDLGMPAKCPQRNIEKILSHKTVTSGIVVFS